MIHIKNSHDGIALIPILIAVVVLIGIGGFGYYLYTNQSATSESTGSVTRTTKSDQEEHTLDGQTYITGDNVELPKDFPKEVPIYPKAVITSASYKNKSAQIQQNSSDSRDEITAWYKDLGEKEDWQLDFDYPDDAVKITTLNYSTSDFIIGFSIREEQGEDNTTLIIANYSDRSEASKGIQGEDQTVGETYDDAQQMLKDLENKVQQE